MVTEISNRGAFPRDTPFTQSGLTKRELIAAMILQGTLSNPSWIDAVILAESENEKRISAMAAAAIEIAEELLKQLDQRRAVDELAK